MSKISSSPANRKRTLVDMLRELKQPKVAVMLALGFSSGLPFLLTANTFGYWLRDAGTSLLAIGFISWVGFAYAFKVYWSPIVDRLDLPLLGRLGRRRGWMLLCQLLVAIGLLGMAVVGTNGGLAAIGVFALLTAFASATQDIVIDAWRIEAAKDSDEVGLMTSAAQLGYRIALLVTDALVIAMAARLGWSLSYVAMAMLMAIGVVATLFAFEPVRADIVLTSKPPLWTLRGLLDAVIGPFVDFFAKHKTAGLLMLLMVALYRLPDFVMGPMYNPYYHDLGLTKDTVAFVRGTFGLVAVFAGIAAGGLSAVRLGMMPTLIVGLVIEGVGTAAFALLGMHPEPTLFATVMTLDSFAQAYAGVALVTYMSSLTSLGYTATQYALLSSTYALLGKFLKGFSGAAVEALTPTYGLLDAYATAFVATGLTAIPPLILLALLWRIQVRAARSA
ncbi:MFS transporter [Undibacterium sp. RTI2.1]|uniref:AmpG family muropeptide MFS transporter n=1 Tax=unclassified Undibacterium TaxID=2630295 RepID=UPI002AB5A0CA|nr:MULTISPECIES: MFS transporter [unclassified Undibacterium]MDY7539933.1 MFS transporter [Undibacterium sp. 5I1]MEB0031156.1 MFS transporter [Undibacterium sp. RTI2.1]MEB0116444.1 MFS transporter [Undibacterium sp. RTI2.2]MEB0230540.1 MFS transporter [Undibacterium sp. 10I3]MEB0257238.1 MFS transporter [Undibacterium sp. 5I1]